MDFYTYTTTRDACSKAGLDDAPEAFYETALADALAMQSAQFFFQLNNERDWEKARRPYYNVWPSIVPMLTRLNLDLDSALIRLPLPALCVRLPKQKNPLTFDWRGQPFRSAASDGRHGRRQGHLRPDRRGRDHEQRPVRRADLHLPQFPPQEGLTVEQSLAGLGKAALSDIGVQVPPDLVTDCVRLCCTLCLLENDPSVISPDVLSKDRDKFESTGDQKYVDKAHRRGKVGWNVGRHIEVAPHYRRPHMALVWTGRAGRCPRSCHGGAASCIGNGGKGAEWVWRCGGAMEIGDWVFFKTRNWPNDVRTITASSRESGSLGLRCRASHRVGQLSSRSEPDPSSRRISGSMPHLPRNAVKSGWGWLSQFLPVASAGEIIRL